MQLNHYDGSKHGEARRVRKGQRWSAHLGWGTTCVPPLTCQQREGAEWDWPQTREACRLHVTYIKRLGI
jgi:hypothetical protein